MRGVWAGGHLESSWSDRGRRGGVSVCLSVCVGGRGLEGGHLESSRSERGRSGRGGRAEMVSVCWGEEGGGHLESSRASNMSIST